jgi:hypothetical protein
MLTRDLLLLTVTLANDRPLLSSERAPHINKPATILRWVLYSKTDWPTEGRS